MAISPGNMAWFASIVLAGFLLDWLAVAFKWEWVKPFSKPSAMILVILWTLSSVSWRVDFLVIVLLLAQGLGLLGDVFLLFPYRFFMHGLVSFLLGHFCYLGLFVVFFMKFLDQEPVSDAWIGWSLLSLILWGSILLFFYLIYKPLSKPGGVHHSMWIPTQIYAWVLSGMVTFSFLAMGVFSELIWAIFMIFTGELLFLISDFVLSYNKFLHPIPGGHLWVRITYHLAQFSLAWGFLMILT